MTTKSLTDSHAETLAIVQEIRCSKLTIAVGNDGDRQYLQVGDGEWTGRKWLLSPHMVPGEIVQTALAAVLAWYEHEAREAFTYRGKAIFNPHLSLDALLERADCKEERAK